MVDLVNQAAGGSGLGAEDAIRSTVDSLMGSATGGTIALIIGIATALWSASAYIKAYGRVANQIYEVPEGRGPIRMYLTMLLLTIALIVGILLIMISILLNATLVEGHASEVNSKRNAMDNASKNAGDMITNLNLLYNRGRQAAITNELIDIVTGASSV